MKKVTLLLSLLCSISSINGMQQGRRASRFIIPTVISSCVGFGIGYSIEPSQDYQILKMMELEEDKERYGFEMANRFTQMVQLESNQFHKKQSEVKRMRDFIDVNREFLESKNTTQGNAK